MNLLLQNYDLAQRNPEIFLKIYISVTSHCYNDWLQTTDLLQKYDLLETNTMIFLCISTRDDCNMTLLLSKYDKVNLLQIQYPKYRSISLTASGEFLNCPILTHLIFERWHIDESVPRALRRAIQSGKLPSLKYLTLIDCCTNMLYFDWPDKVEVSQQGIRTICERCFITLDGQDCVAHD